jgi:pimeloyl-ACP methyl ester carboxylesterase
MSLTLICLHGFTQNGRLFAEQLAGISERAPQDVRWVLPDAPHRCKPESVAQLAAAFRMPEPPPPHLCWWNASDDGAEYRGWEATREQLRELCTRRDDQSRVGVLGFSQGAIAATALAALHAHGELPALDFAILIAGRLPRAAALSPYLQQPIALPSLHVWGERDSGAVLASPTLAEAFLPSQREIVTWRGPHAVPQRGAAADAIVNWIARFS